MNRKNEAERDEFGLYFDGLLQGAFLGAMGGLVLGVMIGTWWAA